MWPDRDSIHRGNSATKACRHTPPEYWFDRATCFAQSRKLAPVNGELLLEKDVPRAKRIPLPPGNMPSITLNPFRLIASAVSRDMRHS